MSENKSKSKKEGLALTIAKSFNDEENVRLYQYMLNHYKESAVKNAYNDTLKVPDEKIKKTRPALFFYLVKKYESIDEKKISSVD